MTISRADVQAAFDVVNQLTNEIDDMGVDSAIQMKGEIDKLQKAAKLCSELLETRAVNGLDGQPAKVGNKFYAPEASGKWRPDHKEIRRLIRERALSEAVNKATGEVEAGAAVRVALDLIYSGFVSESKMPNQRMLEALGVDNKAISTYERGRKKLKVLGTETEVDDDG